MKRYNLHNSNKIILDLCGGSGSWSKPYFDNGYTVYNITIPKYNVNYISFANNTINFGKDLKIDMRDVYGILAAPPCTMFSFARTHAKKPRDLTLKTGGMREVLSCLKIIWNCQMVIESNTQKASNLTFWCLENPYGLLQWFLGKPVFTFHPYEFGDFYSKRTQLWGLFNPPEKYIKLNREIFRFRDIDGEFMETLCNIKSIGDNIFKDSNNRQYDRSITPSGFAEAFYLVNQ